MIRSALPSLALVAVALTPAQSAVLRVPLDHPTIQAGVDAAAAGDTVLVAPGYYTDQSDRLDWAGFLNTACVHLKGGVTLLSEGGPDVTTVELASSGPGFLNVMTVWQASAPVVIEGFSIVSTVPAVIGSGVDGIEVRDSPGLILRNCIIRDFGTGPGDAGVALIGTPAEIDGCTFRDINADGALGGSRADIVVRNSVFENIVGSAVSFSRDTDPGPLTAEITGCTFVNISPIPGVSSPVFIAGFEHIALTGSVIRDCTASAITSGAYIGGSTCTVRDNLFLNNRVTQSGRGGAGWIAVSAGTITQNTIVGCSQEASAWGGAALRVFSGTVDLSHNVIADCSGAAAIGIPANVTATINSSCNVFWNNPQGNAFGFTLDSTDVDADPRFCDPLQDDYTVDDLSPCLPANSGGCSQIGAFGMGCGAVSVEDTSWGALKGMYR